MPIRQMGNQKTKRNTDRIEGSASNALGHAQIGLAAALAADTADKPVNDETAHKAARLFGGDPAITQPADATEPDAKADDETDETDRGQL